MRDLGLNGRNGLERNGFIKSIQRGTITPGTATITAVDLNNSLLFYNGIISVWVGSASGNEPNGWLELTNATTITMTASGTSGVATISWEVVEYYPGVIRSVQRGHIQIGSLTNTATINAVNLNKTQLFYHGTGGGPGSGAPVAYNVGYAVLTNSTTVTVTRGGNDGSVVQVGYQVVEWF